MIKTSHIGWVATTFIIGATVIRALDYSNFLDLALTFAGCGLWTICGIREANRPLVTVNVFSVLVVGLGLWRYV